MSTATIAEVATRKKAAKRSAFAALFLVVAQVVSTHTAIQWPSPFYQKNPTAFSRDILGCELWEKQVDILEGIRDHQRVSVRSGHKIGKSNTAAVAALWFYCSFPDARVVMSSTTSRQVDAILWRELRKIKARSGLCVSCKKENEERIKRHEPSLKRPCAHSALIDGKEGELARTGLKSEDFREIVGFTAKEAEAVAGVSGANLLYLIDEASGVPDVIFEAIEGNRAGGEGTRVALFSNPTQTSGEFFRSHTDKKEFYKCIHVSSCDTPNAKSGQMLIPGLATAGWIAEKREEWGEESALYQVRVLGNFAQESATRVIGLHVVTEAEARWPDTIGEGPLHVGVDVARFGDDDTAIAVRRGDRIEELITFNGLREEEVASRVVQTVRKHHRSGEPKAVVKVDSCGGIGMRVCFALRGYVNDVELVPVNVSEVSRLRNEFPLLRDQLWFGLASWLREGGAVPEDAKLSAELVAPEFSFDARQRRRVESKDEMRRKLKRSPDRADAVALAVWDPAIYGAQAGNQSVDDEPEPDTSSDFYDAGVIDPYGGGGDFQ